MTLAINKAVKTPLGEGRVQGAFLITDQKSEPVVRGILVRLPLNDVTRPALKESRCMTPAAEQSGLWVFPEDEVS
jgi:hypothetical protein